MNVEFPGQLVERQQLVSVVCVARPPRSPLEHQCGYGPSPAIPRAKGFQRDITAARRILAVRVRSRGAVREARTCCAHDAIRAAVAKRPPACVAGDQRHFRR